MNPFWNQAAKECRAAVFSFQAEVWAEKEYISAIGQPVNYLILGNLKTLDEETLHDIGNVELATQLSGLDNEVWRLGNLVKWSCQTGKVELVDTCKSTWQIGQANSTPECVVFWGGGRGRRENGGAESSPTSKTMFQSM